MSDAIKGNILTSAGWVRGEINFDERIAAIHGASVDPLLNDDDYIIPGFIDLHVHGGAGKDIMEGGDAVHAIAAIHARHGTTSMLATTMTAPPEDNDHALKAIGEAANNRRSGGARVLGAHLEGPYINSGKLGAQPNFARAAKLADVERLATFAPLKLITVAPEIAGHLNLVRELTDAGMRVQIGHTLGSYEDGVAALEHGAAGFTHLFNAMRAIPKLYCVTDSTAATGMPDGEYMLGRHTVHKCMGGVRLPDGTLAGSTLTMDQALRNLVGLGLDLADASARVSTYAADYLGLQERGRLAPGAYADFVVLDRDLNLKAVYIEGELL